MKKENGLKNFAILYYSIGLYFNAYFYLTWTVFGTIIPLLLKAMSYSSVLLMLFVAYTTNGISLRISYRKFGILIWAIVLSIYIIFSGGALHINDVILFLNILALLLVDRTYHVQIFDYSMKIFAIFVLPSLIYYLLSLAGIDFPHSVLWGDHMGKNMAGVYYNHYPFGLIMVSRSIFPRYCGVFDEPGVVGTLASFFFAGAYMHGNKKKWWLLLLVEGIFSFSMAFYVLIVVFFITHAFMNGAVKFGAVMVVLVLAFLLFLSIETDNKYIRYVQNRIDLESFFLVHDNRTGAGFDHEYDAFFAKGGGKLIFGNGRGTVSSNYDMFGASSYKCIIYEYGILGSAIYFGFFAFAAYLIGMNKRNLPFIMIFIASVYQRPYVFTVQYTSMFITAVTALKILSESTGKLGCVQEEKNVSNINQYP